MAAEKLSRRVKRTYLDEDTGQTQTLVHEEPLKRRPPRDTRSTEPFAMVFPEGMRRLAQLGLSQTDHDVLDQLIGTMGFEEPFKASPTKIGEALGLQTPNVSRSLRHLRDLGVIVDQPGRMVYLHPDYFWRGSLASRVHLLRNLEKATKNRAPAAPSTEDGSGRQSVFHVKHQEEPHA